MRVFAATTPSLIMCPHPLDYCTKIMLVQGKFKRSNYDGVAFKWISLFCKFEQSKFTKVIDTFVYNTYVNPT